MSHVGVKKESDLTLLLSEANDIMSRVLTLTINRQTDQQTDRSTGLGYVHLAQNYSNIYFRHGSGLLIL